MVVMNLPAPNAVGRNTDVLDAHPFAVQMASFYPWRIELASDESNASGGYNR